jgi:hypothetical protein
VLEKMIDGRLELGLGRAAAAKLQEELQGVKAELEKKEPDKSLVAKGIEFIEKMAGEATLKAAGKLGGEGVEHRQECLHQLGQIVIIASRAACP